MERICRQMGDVTDKLLPTAVAELFTPQLQEAEKVGIDKVALHSFILSIAITSKIFTGKKVITLRAKTLTLFKDEHTDTALCFETHPMMAL